MSGPDGKYFTTHHPARWQRADGTFDVLAYCRWLDDNHNAGAGKPRLTSGSDAQSNTGSTTMEGGPGAALTAPDQADPSVEGASNGAS